MINSPKEHFLAAQIDNQPTKPIHTQVAQGELPSLACFSYVKKNAQQLRRKIFVTNENLTSTKKLFFNVKKTVTAKNLMSNNKPKGCKINFFIAHVNNWQFTEMTATISTFSSWISKRWILFSTEVKEASLLIPVIPKKALGTHKKPCLGHQTYVFKMRNFTQFV